MKRLIEWLKRKKQTDGCVYEDGKARPTTNSLMKKLMEAK